MTAVGEVITQDHQNDFLGGSSINPRGSNVLEIRTYVNNDVN